MLASAPFYFADASLSRGLDHDIVSAYAASIQARLQIIPAATPAAIRACLRQGRAHIGIAGVMPPPADPRIITSAACTEGEWVVARRGQKLTARLADIPHTAPLSAGNERGQTDPQPGKPRLLMQGQRGLSQARASWNPATLSIR